MESTTIPAPALRDTMERTVALLSANVSMIPATMGPLATKETTVMCVNVHVVMGASTASSCFLNPLKGQSSLTSPNSMQNARAPSSRGLQYVLELSWSLCSCWAVLPLWSVFVSKHKSSSLSKMPVGVKLRP